MQLLPRNLFCFEVDTGIQGTTAGSGCDRYDDAIADVDLGNLKRSLELDFGGYSTVANSRVPVLLTCPGVLIDIPDYNQW